MNEGHSAAMVDQAAAWVSRMDSASWSEEDEAALQHWLREEPRRAGALLQAQAAWVSLDPREPVAVAAAPRWPRRRVLAAGGAAIAASVAGAFGLFGQGTVYETAVGEMVRVPLGDGSIAAINTLSKIHVNLLKQRREVSLDRGEAWFQVAKDCSRPFVVTAGSAMVEAVGTAFAVRRRGDEVEVLVTEGVVRAMASPGSQAMLLTAGQRAMLRRAVVERTAGSPNPDRALAWRDGRIDLSGESLGEAVAEFNRYNERQIELVDPKLAGEQLDGVFRTDDIEGFANAVHDALNVPVRATGGKIIQIGRVPGA